MMFLDELNPLFQELIQKPLAFTGGFVSGVFKLNPETDPLMGWISQTTGLDFSDPTSSDSSKDDNSGPQTIDIE